MSKLKAYTVETADVVYAQLDEEKNKYITETAGFIPLEVKLKRYEEAGIQLQFSTGEFTSTDYRDMYLNPDFEITPEDDFEEIQEKLQMREKFVQELKLKKQQISQSDGIKTSEGGTDDQQPKNEAEKSE